MFICVYSAFGCSVCEQRPYDGLIPRPRSPTGYCKLGGGGNILSDRLVAFKQVTYYVLLIRRFEVEHIHTPGFTCSIDWAQLSGFYLKTETESSLRNVVF
jgi:hypothetical protein